MPGPRAWEPGRENQSVIYLSLHPVYLVILKKTWTIADAWMDSATAVIHLSTLNVWITCNAL